MIDTDFNWHVLVAMLLAGAILVMAMIWYLRESGKDNEEILKILNKHKDGCKTCAGHGILEGSLREKHKPEFCSDCGAGESIRPKILALLEAVRRNERDRLCVTEAECLCCGKIVIGMHLGNYIRCDKCCYQCYKPKGSSDWIRSETFCPKLAGKAGKT